MSIKISPPNKIKEHNERHIRANNKSKKDFIRQANKHKPLQKKILGKNNIEHNKYQELPWNNPIVREDVTKMFNLRLSEPDWLKLKYISDNTKESMHSLCLDILIPAIHRKLKKIIPNN